MNDGNGNLMINVRFIRRMLGNFEISIMNVVGRQQLITHLFKVKKISFLKKFEPGEIVKETFGF